LRHDRIEAPWFIEGPIDGDSFRLYVEKVLLPTLRRGDIVVMDNLGSQRSKTVRQLIRSAGAKLFFLPKYSPDLNPIEQVFASISCEKRLPEQSKLFASPSAMFSSSSRPRNAQATW
jgi:transposase